MPTPGSTTSSGSVARPAPSRATAPFQSARRSPGATRRIRSVAGNVLAIGSRRATSGRNVDLAADRPPGTRRCAQFSTPAPDRGASPRGVPGFGARLVALAPPATMSIRACQQHGQMFELLRTIRPLSVSIDSITSSELPTIRPSGASIAVISASVRRPDATPMATSDSASRRESARVFMNAPLPVFTSSTRAADPLRDLLAHDRRADERDALDRAGDVAQRVQLLVGRGDLLGLADHRAAHRRQRRAAAHRARGRSRKPGIASSLSSVPPVCPSPRPDIIGT